MTNTERKKTAALAEIVRRTGLIYRPLDLASLNEFFAEVEKYDEDERMATFEYLRQALNATRRSVASEPIFRD
jgi:hypothetical protein